jgi:hypothetical protein
MKNIFIMVMKWSNLPKEWVNLLKFFYQILEKVYDYTKYLLQNAVYKI